LPEEISTGTAKTYPRQANSQISGAMRLIMMEDVVAELVFSGERYGGRKQR
jgi:hypothetical protein